MLLGSTRKARHFGSKCPLATIASPGVSFSPQRCSSAAEWLSASQSWQMRRCHSDTAYFTQIKTTSLLKIASFLSQISGLEILSNQHNKDLYDPPLTSKLWTGKHKGLGSVNKERRLFASFVTPRGQNYKWQYFPQIMCSHMYVPIDWGRKLQQLHVVLCFPLSRWGNGDSGRWHELLVEHSLHVTG